MELIIKNTKELKKFVSTNRRDITNINGIKFTEIYPMLEVSNSNAFYYDVESQGYKLLKTPFKITTL